MIEALEDTRQPAFDRTYEKYRLQVSMVGAVNQEEIGP